MSTVRDERVDWKMNHSIERRASLARRASRLRDERIDWDDLRTIWVDFRAIWVDLRTIWVDFSCFFSLFSFSAFPLVVAAVVFFFSLSCNKLRCFFFLCAHPLFFVSPCFYFLSSPVVIVCFFGGDGWARDEPLWLYACANTHITNI